MARLNEVPPTRQAKDIPPMPMITVGKPMSADEQSLLQEQIARQIEYLHKMQTQLAQHRLPRQLMSESPSRELNNKPSKLPPLKTQDRPTAHKSA